MEPVVDDDVVRAVACEHALPEFNAVLEAIGWKCRIGERRSREEHQNGCRREEITSTLEHDGRKNSKPRGRHTELSGGLLEEVFEGCRCFGIGGKPDLT